MVSRALAVIQFVTAILDASSLPDRLISLVHHTREIEGTAAQESLMYFIVYDRVSALSSIARITFLLVIGLIFWNCGPWVQRLLLPQSELQRPIE